MDKETLEKLEQMATRANGARVVQGIPQPAHIVTVEDRDGELKNVVCEPAPRSHNALSLAAIVAFVRDNINAVAWYSREAVIGLFDDFTRRDQVKLELQLSPQIEQLMEMERIPKKFKQPELILLLRTTFAACLGACGELLANLRNVNFKAGSESSSSVQHGSSSVGRGLRAELTATKPIPELIGLEVPIFANAFSFTARVQVAIDIDPVAETFRLIPLPLEIERAIVSGEERIGARLLEMLQDGEDTRPVYYGSP